jgi:hypothetical protein
MRRRTGLAGIDHCGGSPQACLQTSCWLAQLVAHWPVGAGSGGTAGAGVAGVGGAAGGAVEEMMQAFWQVVARASQPVVQPAGVCAGVCACAARKFRSAAHIGAGPTAISKEHATSPHRIAVFRDPKAVRFDVAEDMRSPFNSRRDIKAVSVLEFHQARLVYSDG